MKKLISVVLTFTFFITLFQVTAFAIQGKPSLLETTTMEDLSSMSKEEKLLLLKEFKEKYNFYDYNESEKDSDKTKFSENNQTVSPAWASGDAKDPNYSANDMQTHELMTLDALGHLYDQGYFLLKDPTEAVVLSLHIAMYSAYPDILGEGMGFVFDTHFYDPKDGENYLHTGSRNARKSFVREFEESKEYFAKVNGIDLDSPDYKAALEHTGKALHFLQDCCEPHHTTKSISLGPIADTPHSEFEEYVNTYYDILRGNGVIIWDSAVYNYMKGQDSSDMGMLVHLAAEESSAMISYVNDLTDKSDWEMAGRFCIFDSIQYSGIAARLIFEESGELVKL